METLVSALLVCLNLSAVEAANGVVLKNAMAANCKVMRASQGKRQGEPWLNATIDCKCKASPK